MQAVSLLDDFLTKIWKRKIPCFVISGNHDSAERLSFGSKLMEEGKIYVSKSYDGNVTPIELKDEFGPVNIYMLPFISPVEKSFTEAVEQAVQKMNVDVSKRNVLISHQLVTGAERSDSEDLSFGGAEDVAIEVFDCFDYVALGHIHKPQKCGREFVRYSGTPLKYSFSEVNHKKSVTIVELKEKKDITVRTVALEPRRDLRVIKGSFEEITKKEFYEKQNRQDFVKIILTNEDDVKDGFARLSTIYENLVFLDYDNKRTRSVSTIEDLDKIIASMAETAKEAGVTVVTGDTKVVEKRGDFGGIMINTSGVGFMPEGVALSPAGCKDGDALIVSGNLGDHHAAILSNRMNIQNSIKSDNAPLTEMVSGLIEQHIDVHAMRDVTRGGLGTVLHEFAGASDCEIHLYQDKLPVSPAVRDFCKMLGLDPVYMGNEGKMICVVDGKDAEKALSIIKTSKYGENAAIIGEVKKSDNNGVVLHTAIGGERLIGPLYGEGLPRIC